MKKIDIFIPTCDRPIMLDLILESISINLNGYNKIYVFFEASNNYFFDGYKITKNKYTKIFGEDILFLKKDSLIHTTKLFNQYLENDLLILTDDCLIFKSYDLLEDSSSKIFFEENKIISNSLRFSIDMFDQLPSNERSTNFFKNDSTNANKQIFNFPKPNFINFKFSDHVDKEFNNVTPSYGIWNIYDNLNSSLFSSFLNPSLQIFRKDDFLRWINKYGKSKSFLNIPEALKFEFYPNILNNKILYFILDKLDKIYHFICIKISKNKVKASHIFKNFFSSYFSKTKKLEFRHLMCCPKEQIGFDYNIGSHHINQNISIFQKLNEKYLDGFVIDYKKFISIKKNYPFAYITIDRDFFIENLIIKNEKV